MVLASGIDMLAASLGLFFVDIVGEVGQSLILG